MTENCQKRLEEMEWNLLSVLERAEEMSKSKATREKKKKKTEEGKNNFTADHTRTHTVARVTLQSMNQNKSNKSFIAELYGV